MKTAVEFLVETLAENGILHSSDIEQAKEMFELQIKDSFVECWKSNVTEGIECKLSAEEYYNETFKTNG
jgi:hypothetical protein